MPYDGTPVLHNAGRALPSGDSVIRWARWRPHRLSGIEAWEQGGFTIQTIARSAGELYLNYRYRAGGWIKVELLRSIPSRKNPDVPGTPGYTFADCDRLTGDHEDRVVTWKGSADLAVASETLVIRVQMFAATLFAYRV